MTLRLGSVLFLAGALARGHAAAPSSLPDDASVQSRSGQFTAQWLYRAAPDPGLEADPSLVPLDPAVVVVSCEHVREALWRDLGVRGPWASKVSLVLFPALTPDEGVTVASDRFASGWRYQVYLPQMVERGRYVRAMTEVVLLELANRGGGERGAEIPAWLLEGFAERLLAGNDPRLVLPSPDSRPEHLISLPTTVMPLVDPLTHAHEVLSRRPSLTFQDLSWPDAARRSGADDKVYRCSAHLLVSRLLQLPDGRACLRSFLANLPSHYNWQFAFLPAFRSHFERPLEVEKWWAVQAAGFAGRRLDQTWATETSLKKLGEALRASVEVRTDTNELPLHAEGRLQNVVRDLNPAMQSPVIQAKINELSLLRSQVAPKLVPLVDEYRTALTRYLRTRDKPGLTLPFRRAAVQRHNVEKTVAQLNALDAHRDSLAKINSSPPPVAPDAPANGSAETVEDLAAGFGPVPPPSRAGR